ncbi:hypothetical protein D6D73_08280 [Moraxella catarrhalis]|uniref:hypothetical protein n=1 Tax=Moraxella catarrhalis TaxID=480 RepID=UPI000EA99423|nr:hypothetical protein [Moraxella catarrhalis]RKL93804.1 hypothetical protein D6D78_00245 [Moraxella catarrhalis]RKL94849.1 hypothetical protein D6D73_08280 [Moraxella catarrhalis]
MSNFDTVFSTAPKWTNVEAIDATDVINSAYKNAELQNKAFDKLASAGADVFTYAQQHKLNEVEKEINAMNLDQFQTTDKAALIDDLITKYGTDIGGFDAANINSINKYVDGRDTTLIKDALDAFDYDSKSRKNITEAMQFDADNIAGEIHDLTKTASLLPDGHPDKDKAYQRIEALTGQFITKYPGGSTFLNSSLRSITNADKKAKTEELKLDNAHADEAVKAYGPAYTSYLTQLSNINAKEAEANKLEDSEAKKQALADIAFAKAALTAHYGSEVIESLKNPLILARLEQKASEDLHAKRMNEVEYQAATSAIENAKKELDIKGAKVQNDQKLGEQKNAIELFKATNGGDGSGGSSSEVKARKETNLNRIIDMGVDKKLAAGFIGDDGEFSPAKTLATAIAHANKLKTNEDNLFNTTYDETYSHWLNTKGIQMAKQMRVSEKAFNAYKEVVAELGVPEIMKRAIIEAGISGRLDKYYTGNGSGPFDSNAVFRNEFRSNIRQVLEDGKMLKTIENEVKNNAYHRNAQEFQKILNAIEVAYPTGMNGFIQDNAKTLINNMPFLYYIGPEYREMVKKAASITSKEKQPPPTNHMGRNAGNTLGVLQQPTAFPTPSNTSPLTGLPKPPPTQKQQSKSNDKEKNQSKTPTSTAPKTPVGWERSVENGKKSLDEALRYFGIN